MEPNKTDRDGEKRRGKTPRETLAMPGRRLILGGIPIAVTLASKPAMAMGECSVSNALSGHLSHPLPAGVNCGLTPDCWTKLAGTNQLWTRTGCSPSTRFIDACGSQPNGSVWSCGSQSMLAALEGSLVVSCKINGADTALNAGQFGAHCAAGILNASCFSPTNYPKTMAEVENLIAPLWSQHPANQTLAQNLLDNVTSQLSSLNVNS
jgi:hypothetical protein